MENIEIINALGNPIKNQVKKKRKSFTFPFLFQFF